MNATVSGRASFWRETFRGLKAFAQTEWQWMGVFAAIIAIEQRLPFLAYNSSEMIARIKNASGDPLQSIRILNEYLPHILAASLVSLVTLGLAAFVFTTLYLRHTVTENVPDFSLQTFFRWFSKMVQKYFILFVPLFLAICIFSLISSLVPERFQNVTTFGFVVLFSVWIFYLYYGIYALYVVTPLVILRAPAPMRQSYDLTKAHLFRVWWESVIVWAILVAAFIPLVIVNYEIARMFGITSTAAHSATALIDGIWESVSAASMALYACIVLRVLSQERTAKH